MDSIVFIILRRMRAPLILLIAVYAIAITGLVLIPGVDAQGRAAPPLSFFHAFYFVSFTASTIGFGEIPSAFSEAQRVWVVFCIYLTVISWSTTLITLLALFQDRNFQGAVARLRCGDRLPLVWSVRLERRSAHAIAQALQRGTKVHLGELLADCRAPGSRLPVLALLLRRPGQNLMLPPDSERLEPGDEILFAGQAWARQIQGLTLENANALDYVLRGRDRPRAWIWQWLRKRRRRAHIGIGGSQ